MSLMDGPPSQAPFSEGGNLSAVISQLEENTGGCSLYGGPGFLPQHFSDLRIPQVCVYNADFPAAQPDILIL